VLERLGVIPLELRDVRHRNAYLGKLSAEQRQAYNDVHA